MDALLKWIGDALSFDRAWAWRDPDLALLQNDPRFEQIVGAPPQNKLANN